MNASAIMVVGGILALIVGGVVWGQYQKRRRTEAWRQAAAALQLDYFDQTNDLLGTLEVFRSLSKGRGRKFTEGIRGDAGDTQITVADYQFVTGSGKSQRIHRWTICILRGDGQHLPACILRPDFFLHSFFAHLFGRQDIDFAEDSEFSKAYRLQGDNETAIRQLFGPSCRQWFTARRSEGLHFEASGSSFLFHTGKRVNPSCTRELMQQAIEMQRRLAGLD